MSGRQRFTAPWGSIFALLFYTSASAQSAAHTLTIRVVDPVGAPVPGAQVTVTRRDARLLISRESDTSGEARFEALIAGAYVLEIDAPGFAPLVQSIALASEMTTVTLSLPLAGVTEHVVVTGARQLQTTSETSKAVTVIDSEEIAARNEFSVADALRTVPGATVQQLGGPGSFTSVKLRGLREQDTSLLIDGVRFRDAASPQGDATAFISELYITNLDRVEVLRGSGSSLYGSHAIGGAVNLITTTGSGRPSGNIGAEFGGLGFSRLTAHTTGGALAERLAFTLGAGHTRVLRGVDGDDDARNTSIQGRVNVRLATSARASVRIYGAEAASSINESPAAIGPLPSIGFVRATPSTFVPAANDPDDVRDSAFLSMLLVFEQRPSTAFGYSLSLHRLLTDRVFRDGPLGVSAFEPVTQTSSRFEGTVHTLELRGDRQWSARHITSFAYEFEREQYVSQSLPVNAALAWNADITQDSQAVSLHHDMRLDPLQFTGGIRAQRFSLNEVALLPAERAPFAATAFVAPPSALTADISAMRRIASTGTKLRVHAGNAYRAPAMFERAGVSFGSRGYSVFGDPTIEPERSVSVDASADQQFMKGRALFSATWFRTRLRRVISFQSLDRATDPLGRSSGYRTADGRTAHGVELSLQIQPHPTFQASAAYTFADAPPPAGSRDGSPRAAAVAAHQFSALMTQRLGRVHVSFELEAASDHYVPLFDPVSFGSRAYQFEGVTRGDVTASYRLPRRRVGARLFGTVENVFDRTYFVQGFPAAGRVARGGLAVTF